MDRIYAWIMNYFLGKPLPEKEPTFIEKIEAKGYFYDEDKDYWVRKWTTNPGQENEESILEAYKQECDENGPTDKWKQLMIGYGETVFYEEDVSDDKLH